MEGKLSKIPLKFATLTERKRRRNELKCLNIGMLVDLLKRYVFFACNVVRGNHSLTADTDLLNEVKEGAKCMLVKFFARKAAWLKFTADNADGPATQ